MVVKTETCSFSGLRIYPGHGIFFVRGDSKGFRFIGRKVKSLFHQRLNPRKLAWTVLYRRMHKKGTLEESTKKKVRCKTLCNGRCDVDQLWLQPLLGQTGVRGKVRCARQDRTGMRLVCRYAV